MKQSFKISLMIVLTMLSLIASAVGVTPAHAAPVDLSNNLVQNGSADGAYFVGNSQWTAQAFTTSATNSLVTSVVIALCQPAGGGVTGTFAVEIWDATGAGGAPGAKVADIDTGGNASSLSVASVAPYSCTPITYNSLSIALSPSTTYYLIARAVSLSDYLWWSATTNNTAGTGFPSNKSVYSGGSWGSPDQSVPAIMQVVADTGSLSAITVTSIADSGAGSLRQAIADIASGGTITFDSSLSGQTIYLASTLTLNKDVTIDGSSLASQVTLSGDSDNNGSANIRIMSVNSGVTATINGLTFNKGTSNSGSAINNAGTLTVQNSLFTNNFSGDKGGALYNYVTGTMNVIGSTFTGNTSTWGGAGIQNDANPFNQGGVLYVTNSTFYNNTDINGYGGGVHNGRSFYGNVTATLKNNTFSNNSNGVYVESGTVHLINNIVANSTGPNDVAGSLATNLNNLTGTVPLNALASNGGPTQTMSLPSGSPALGAGDAATCAASPVNNLDQRGQSRPQGDVACDIGAYESAAASVTPVTVTADNKTITYGDSDPTFTFTSNPSITFDTDPTCGVSGAHTNAGSYTISCSGGSASGYSLSHADGTLTINKADPTLSVTNSPVTYDGSPHAATVSGSVPGAVNNVSTGGSATQINAGTYAVTADFAPTDTTNYNTLTGASAGNLIINKADPTLSVTNSPVTYDGSSHAATVAGSVSGSVSNVQYDASTSEPVLPGTYAVTADFTPTDTTNYNNLSGASAGNFAIVSVGSGPLLIYPANGASLPNLRPPFDWADYAGATGYQFQVSASSSFGTLVLNKSSIASAYTPITDLPANRVLYWRVRAKVGAAYSAWSAVWTFTTGNPPSTPNLGFLANNQLTTDYTPRLDWSNSIVPFGTSFDHYQIQVASNAGFASPVVDEDISGLTNSEFTPSTDLADNTKYYWRVRGYNTLGHYSAWSVVQTFRAALLPPTLNNPADTAVLLNKRPTFDWNAVPDATGYTIQVSRNATFTLLVVNSNSASVVFTPSFDLPAGMVLYWRVRSNGTNGPSAWSLTDSFTTGNPPSTPLLSAPLNNALTTNYTPLLDWTNSALPLGTTFDHYQVQVDDNSDFSSTVLDANTTTGSITASSYTPAPLADNTRYYWRVRAFNNAGEYSAWSAVRYFRAPLVAPTLSTPLNGATGVALKPNFDWADVSGAGGYTIQISTNPTFSTLLMNVTVGTSGYTRSVNLPAGKTLYWRVRANGINGPSAWSTVYSFSTP